MSAWKGRDVVMTWGTLNLTGCREKGVALAGDPIDVTSDEDQGWRTLLNASSQNQVDLNVSGVTKSHQLKKDYMTGDRTKQLTLEYPDGTILTGTFYLATYNETGAYNDASTFDATFQSTGPVTLDLYGS